MVNQGTPLLTGMQDIPAFDEQALVAAIRTDQTGNGTFPEFLPATLNAGIVEYVVDFAARTVAYNGAKRECYMEEYPAVGVEGLPF